MTRAGLSSIASYQVIISMNVATKTFFLDLSINFSLLLFFPYI